MRMSENTLFSDAAKVWLSVKQLEVRENTYSESYERTVDKILLPRIQDLTLGEIDRAFTAQMFSELSNVYSDSTLHKCQLVLEGVFNEAAYAGAKLPPLPKIRIRSKKEKVTKRTYSEEEVELIKEYAKTHRFGLSILLLLELGLRTSEMLALKWEDFDFKARTVNIERACVEIDNKPAIGAPKSEASIRTLPLSKEFCDFLYFYGKSCKGYITLSKNGNLMDNANFTKSRYNRFFRELEEDTGMYRLSPHELRHTCGTLLYEHTKDIYAVSKFLGHSSVVITTKYYIHPTVEMLRNKLNI